LLAAGKVFGYYCRVRHVRRRVLAYAVCAALAAAAPASADVYIVMLKPGVNAATVADEHAARFNGQIRHVYQTLGGYSIDLPDSGASVAAAEIAKDPRVAGVERNRTGALDPSPVRCVAVAATWHPVRCAE
jgi:hypothetical protein